ncbi:MAG: sulfatase-like hydrolase/transferase [Rhodobacteraceae bacterium]|nr:sulfatase-like hydrolase/transferase [Paracoccaceae bacterium]
MRLVLFSRKSALLWLAEVGVYGAFMVALLLLIPTIPNAFFGVTLTTFVGLALIASILVLRRRVTAFLVATGVFVAIVLLLEEANRQKAAATDFPLMATDLKMFLLSTSGVLTSIGAPPWVYVAILVSAAALLAYLGWSAFVAIKTHGVAGFARRTVRFALKLLITVPVLIALNGAVVKRVSSYIDAHSATLSIWEPDGLIELSDRVGVLGFLSYGHFIETGERENFLTYIPLAEPPPRAAIRRSAEKYVRADALHAGVLPNVILVHAESTFDPNDVLNLATPIENSLFYTHYGAEDPMVHVRAPMYVNVVGGGSWVSEFELVTGIDSRLFGVAGRFTHASLSQYTRNTFPRYMRARGYTTAIFTNVEGAFYNYGNGYLNYGYEQFLGGNSIGYGARDIPIMQAALDYPLGDADTPFFKHVLLAENHAPHWCNPEYADAYEDVAFAGEATELMVCALKEYARQAKLTEQAVAMARDYLEAEKSRTGRDYVLAVYGDHQPYSFTGGGSAEHNMGLDFSAVRADFSKRKTILKILSSLPSPLDCCGEVPVPATMLPTLISSYVATSIPDLYLPENLYQYDHCGRDWIGEMIATTFYGRADAGDDRTCGRFETLVAAYKASGVIQDLVSAKAATASASAVAPAGAADFAGTCLDAAGNLQIGITASGTWFGAAPRFRVMLDDIYLGEVVVENALENADRAIESSEVAASAAQFSFSVPITARPETLWLYFINDNWAGPDLPGDTDLWIKSVTISDRLFAAPELEFDATGSMRGNYLGEWFRFATNGHLLVDLPDSLCN